MKESMLEKNKEILELDRDIKVLTTEKYKNEELKDLTNNVQFINLEIIKTEHLLKNNLEFLAFSKLEPEYQKLKDKFEYLTDNNIKSDEIILVSEKIKNIEENIDLMKDKLDKLKIVNEKIEKKFTNEQIIRLSYNKLTGGKYLNCINSYSKEGAIKEKLEVQIKDLEKSYTSKLFNANEIKKLRTELKVVETGIEKIKVEFEALKKSVPENKLVEEILKFDQLKSNLLDENKANQKPINNEIFDEYKKINESKLVLEEFPKLEKEKYIGNILNCLKRDDGKVVGSASVQLDKLDRSDEINFD